jgi:hypothetical protein
MTVTAAAIPASGRSGDTRVPPNTWVRGGDEPHVLLLGNMSFRFMSSIENGIGNLATAAFGSGCMCVANRAMSEPGFPGKMPPK